MIPTHAISIRQPWLDLILRGDKHWEFRSWPVPPAHMDRPLALAACVTLEAAWNYVLHCRASDPPPVTGAILGVGVITYQFAFTVPVPACDELFGEPGLPTVRCDTDNRWWAWKFGAINRIAPIPCRGSQRFWSIPDDVRTANACELEFTR
jgi:hypothetical protein